MREEAGGEAGQEALRGYEAAAESFLERVNVACEVGEWPQCARTAMEAMLALFAADPKLAHLLVLDAYGAGGEVQRQHEEMVASLADLLRRRRKVPSDASMPDTLEESLIGGIQFIIGRSLRDGEADRLLALGPDLTTLLLTPYLGREEAERVAAGARYTL